MSIIRISFHVAACFRIEQNCIYDGLHVTTHEGSVVCKSSGTASHISRTGIARHHLMDQLRADIRAGVGMIEENVNYLSKLIILIILRIRKGRAIRARGHDKSAGESCERLLREVI